jgi:P-type Cu+ transporter
MPETSHDDTESPDVVSRLRIEGMTCSSCVGRVERALRGVPGVRDARVNLTTESATIESAAGQSSIEDLIQAVRAIGYDAERFRSGSAGQLTALESTQSQRQQQQRQAMVQAIGLAVPIVALEWFGPLLQSSDAGAHVWWRILQGLLCTMLIVSPAGGPIIVSGARALLHRSPSMDTLIALGVVTAYTSSVVGVFLPTLSIHHFQAAAMILAFINVGKYFETRARREASGAVSALAKRLPKTALRWRDDSTEQVSIDAIRIGDHLQVAPDTVVPVDGEIVSGTAGIDESAITGESAPVARRPGERVFAGSIVRDGNIRVEAKATGGASVYGAIIRAVEEAQSSKSRLQRLADRASGVFVPVVVFLAVATLVGRSVAGASLGDALRACIAVLVISCPCAMGLAAPTAVLVSTGAAALRGILVRDAAALEAMGQVDVILLDKTGTLTTGSPRVSKVRSVPEDAGEQEVLRLAASVEQYSQHPLGKAVCARAAELGVSLSDPTSFESEPGFGISATLDDRQIAVGSAAYLRDRTSDLGPVDDILTDWMGQGLSVILVGVDGVLAGAIGLTDTIRPDAREAVAELQSLGVTVAMITGDHRASAAAVAGEVGITDIVAETLPDRKREEVSNRQHASGGVAFVGDGINDAPALTAADVGVSFAAGTDVAIAAADITLVSDKLVLIPSALRIARKSVRIIKQNLFWAVGYNAVAIPLAATGHISPGLAAAAMMTSSISVVLNSLRLRSSPDSN